jgi:hypothetical protein
MKFSINFPNPTDIVTPEKIPGGEDNINGRTFQEHFAAAGIVAFTVDMSEIASDFKKTYAAIHMLHKGFGANAPTCTATKRNKLLYRSYSTCTVITDLPFVRSPSMRDTFITDLLGLIWGKLTHREKLYIDVKGRGHEPCMTASVDYTELVAELRSWPQRVIIDEKIIQESIKALEKEFNFKRQHTRQDRLHEILRNQIALSMDKIDQAIQIAGVNNDSAGIPDIDGRANHIDRNQAENQDHTVR